MWIAPRGQSTRLLFKAPPRLIRFARKDAMHWIILFVAGLLEIVWAYFMKRSEGFTLLVPRQSPSLR